MLPEVTGCASLRNRLTQNADGKVCLTQAGCTCEQEALAARFYRKSKRKAPGDECGFSQAGVRRRVRRFVVLEGALRVPAGDAGLSNRALDAKFKAALAVVREAVAVGIRGDEQAGAVAGGAGGCHRRLEARARRRTRRAGALRPVWQDPNPFAGCGNRTYTEESAARFV